MQLKMRFRLMLLCLLGGFVGLALTVGWAFNTIAIDGNLYNRLIYSKDMTADVLPPPLYLIESYLDSLLLSRQTPVDQQQTRQELQRLRQEYQSRLHYWQQNHQLSPALSVLLLERSAASAEHFFAVLDQQWMPAIASQDPGAVTTDHVALQQAYQRHRQTIDAVVKQASLDYDQTRAEAGTTRHMSLLVLGAGFSLLFGLILILMNL